MRDFKSLVDAAYHDLTTTEDGKRFLALIRQYFDSLPPEMGVGHFTLAAQIGELHNGPSEKPDLAMVEAALEHLWMQGEIWSRKTDIGGGVFSYPVWYANRTQNTGF